MNNQINPFFQLNKNKQHFIIYIKIDRYFNYTKHKYKIQISAETRYKINLNSVFNFFSNNQFML